MEPPTYILLPPIAGDIRKS